MGNISINGNDIVVGRSISIVNGNVTIDGNKITLNDKVINIHVEGDIDQLHIDVCNNVIVDGNVNKLTTTSGDISAHTINGDIKTTSGDVEIEGNCGGSVNTVSGDVSAKNIAGSVKTVSGDIEKF